MMLHLAQENYTFVIFGVNLCVCRVGGGGVGFNVFMYGEKYGRPICGWSSLYYCFLGNFRLPVFLCGHSTWFHCCKLKVLTVLAFIWYMALLWT